MGYRQSTYTTFAAGCGETRSLRSCPIPCQITEQSMPELPDVLCYVDALDAHVAGHRIKRVRFVVRILFVPPSRWTRLLASS
jgi:hypothetical protein